VAGVSFMLSPSPAIGCKSEPLKPLGLLIYRDFRPPTQFYSPIPGEESCRAGNAMIPSPARPGLAGASPTSVPYPSGASIHSQSSEPAMHSKPATAKPDCQLKAAAINGVK